MKIIPHPHLAHKYLPPIKFKPLLLERDFLVRIYYFTGHILVLGRIRFHLNGRFHRLTPYRYVDWELQQRFTPGCFEQRCRRRLLFFPL